MGVQMIRDESNNREIASPFTCDACLRPSIYYSNGGKYKISYRCIKHKPSSIYLGIEVYAHKGNKYWVSCQDGVSLPMQKKVDEMELKHRMTETSRFKVY